MECIVTMIHPSDAYIKSPNLHGRVGACKHRLYIHIRVGSEFRRPVWIILLPMADQRDLALSKTGVQLRPDNNWVSAHPWPIRWWQTPRSGSLNVAGRWRESVNQRRFIDHGQCRSRDWSVSRAISHSALIIPASHSRAARAGTWTVCVCLCVREWKKKKRKNVCKCACGERRRLRVCVFDRKKKSLSLCSGKYVCI